MIVTSPSNPKVKAARALHRRKGRDEQGLFLAEGLRSVLEALAAGRAPERLFYAPAAERHPRLDEARAAAGEALEVSEAVLAKVSRRDNPQTVVGVFRQTRAPLEAIDRGRLVIALHLARDPGNVGAVIRTADALGAGAVILVGETCDPFSPEAVRATMGSIFAVPLAQASETVFAAWRGSWPGTVVGTHLGAATDIGEARPKGPVLLVMGGEQAGLPASMTALCDLLVRIPMRGRADSLNLAVATGIAAYALSSADAGATGEGRRAIGLSSPRAPGVIMPDTEPSKVDAPPKPGSAEDLPDAKVGVKDRGKIVGSTAGEAVDGRIADIADGDD